MDTNRAEKTRTPEVAAFLEEPSDTTHNLEIRYPIAIVFIIISKFFERFAFLAIQTVLVIYLTSELSYTNDGATIAFHASSGLQFFAALVGAIVSDNYLGKFRTILVMSGVYLGGVVLLLFGAVPGISLPSSLTLLALILLSFGVGCLKPCFISFGGDQFKLPEQAAQVKSYFSLFYITLRVASLLSTTIAPILRNDVKCFGRDHCFPMVFGASALFSVLAIGFFVAGNSWYRKPISNKSVLLKVFQCIIYSIRNKGQHQQTPHWLDKSIPKYGNTLVSETKVIIRLVVLYLPVPVYFALAQQIGSRFTIQAMNLNGVLPFYTIKPDQFSVVHALLIIALIPVFDLFIYPILKRIGIWKPLHIMTIGGLLTALSFMLAGMLEMRLTETNAVLPSSGECQLRIFNPFPCDFMVKTNFPGHEQFEINSMDSIKRVVNLNRFDEFNNRVEFISHNCLNITSKFILNEQQSISYLMQPTGAKRFVDNAVKSVTGKHLLRILSNNSNQSISILDTVSYRLAYDGRPDINLQVPLIPSEYEVLVDGEKIVKTRVLAGGVTTLLLSNDLNRAEKQHQLIEITPPNSVHILWQMPQYICLSIGDIMFSITGLSFTYAEAPASLKTVMQAFWLFLLAVGNGLDMIVVAAHFFNSQAFEFIAFSALLFADMALFLNLSSRYMNNKKGVVTEDMNLSETRNDN